MDDNADSQRIRLMRVSYVNYRHADIAKSSTIFGGLRYA